MLIAIIDRSSFAWFGIFFFFEFSAPRSRMTVDDANFLDNLVNFRRDWTAIEIDD